jgi:AraC-like DNA-binding protein
MPRLTAEPLFAGDGLCLRRVTCDGVDAVRGGDEYSREARIIMVLHGRFAFEDSRTRAVASPATALVLHDEHTYRIRHVDGGDVCLACQGALCTALVASGGTTRQVSAEGYAGVQALRAALDSGEPVSRLAVEELLCTALAPSHPAAGKTTRRATRDRELARAIGYRLDRDVDAHLSLAEIAAASGVSMFHACRVFRRETGFSIHRYHQEVRLRHALALLLDTDRPVVEIAVELGFANQAHLTNLFRRRFRVTPARVRKTGLR